MDTNVLVYAHRREVGEHAAAFATLTELAQGPRAWAIPWPCIYEFFSIVTNPKIWKSAATTPTRAWEQLQAWRASPTVRLLAETDTFSSLLATFATRARVRGPVIHDARIAALCLAHGVEALLTRDRDFALFPELTVRDPFA